MGIPMYSRQLIALLENEYPLKNPEPSEDMKDLFYRAGQRSVVERLLREAADQIDPRKEDETVTW